MKSEEKYLISAKVRLGDVDKIMRERKIKITFLIDYNSRVIASVSEGDIRRAILSGKNVDSPVEEISNSDFVWLNANPSRETILKKFDQKINIIPILDKTRRLVDIANKDFFPAQIEKRLFARSCAPARVSFGGGGSDLTSYFVKDGGAVINATISLYCHATLKKRDDKKINVFSQDLDANFSCNNIETLKSAPKTFDLFKSLIFVIDPRFGFDLYVDSDFKPGSGLGGSASVAAAVIGCFNEYRKDKWSPTEISGLAFQVERLHMGVAGGWQDQYAAVFGGFNFIEFKEDDNIVHSLKIRPPVLMELEESLMLFDTGITHDSNRIHVSQKKTANLSNIQEKVSENVTISYQLRNCLLSGDLRSFGYLLDRSWQLKKKFSPLISSPYLDSIYSLAIENGATGGKLLGAGGGGYFMFFIPPFEKFKVINALSAKGLRKHNFRFEAEGLKSILSRESNFYDRA